ncbi:REP element-mobilizing transposase RayT [Saccharicrinis carchari]|uniref:REP element-mobilizing transposase RayT n=1 Tax=Saccharicrinis carchari TaxID=1168039 RepID=A0A521E9Y5_SACCC|nr:hypothetical protein [Saccharicrinis carchari]SMO80768.1 REP element-mobilizing transposase RayT [Saccharicrinis carchari]
MRVIQTIEPGYYYHIYNCGINGTNLFNGSDNYEYFMGLYEKYIYKVADTFAWVLMPNHFHALIRIKDVEDIVENINPERVQNPFGVCDAEKITKYVTQQFSNLFNSYAQAFNKRNKRHGSLFEKPFKRKRVDQANYFKNLVLYIHNNPVHHGFCQHPIEYPWSSYLSCISIKPTKLRREAVIGWFDGMANFKTMHNEKVEVIELEKWFEI